MNRQIAHRATQLHVPDRAFTVRLSSTPRGARLARRLAGQELADWGVPHGSDLAERAALVVAELAANAITHGRTPGRDFRLTLLLGESGTAVRIEVTDTRPDRLPPRPEAVRDVPEPADATEPEPVSASGRGLVIVDSLASARGVHVTGRLTKTIWAELRTC